ncbi:MAG: hypothetical protein QM538_04080 [Methylacidiphilales bacterium]|nr:hypothetical protein [Candidatus Methylacidiphilales bacterium]
MIQFNPLVLLLTAMSMVCYSVSIIAGTITVKRAIVSSNPRNVIVSNSRWFHGVMLLTLIFHSLVICVQIIFGEYYIFDFALSLNYTMLGMSWLWLVVSFLIPIPQIALLLIPLNMLIIVVPFILVDIPHSLQFTPFLIFHITSALFAISFLLFATCMSFVLSYIDHSIRSSTITNPRREFGFPSFEQIHQLVFGLLVISFVFLTITIAIGLLEGVTRLSTFTLSQKIFFTIISWFIIAVVVLVRWKKAIPPKALWKWCAVASGSSLLGFLGSKVISI